MQEERMKQTSFTRTHSVFSMMCRVAANIRANAESVWRLLTDAKDLPRWNSTVTSIEGQIQEGDVCVFGYGSNFHSKGIERRAKQTDDWTGGFVPLI
jgi:uncharacterized protein YndB with AHSA1/START domain